MYVSGWMMKTDSKKDYGLIKKIVIVESSHDRRQWDYPSVFSSPAYGMHLQQKLPVR